MHLSTRSRYGVRILLDIARHQSDGPVKVCDISLRQGVSSKYLEKLIIQLREAGLIKSLRGCRGGLLLARPQSSITAGELVRVLEGKQALTDCTEPDHQCSPCQRRRGCPAHRLWIEASRALFATLDAISIAQILRWQDETEEGSLAFCPLPRCMDGTGLLDTD